METPKVPETARGGETTLIGTSIVIKGDLSCGEDLYIDGQVEAPLIRKETADDRAAWARQSHCLRCDRAG
jgi:cytoskeletal protein CcmA (bactofilin family)